MKYGDPDGHGTYGQLTPGDDGGLICHECGQERRFLGRHVREHGMNADQYRERHGLGRSTPPGSAPLAGLTEHRRVTVPTAPHMRGGRVRT